MGHKAGDFALQDFTTSVLKILPENAEMFRIGGDEFVAFVPTIRDDHLERLANTITEFFKNQRKIYTVAVGWDLYIPKKKERFIHVIHRADSAMYLNKAKMKLEGRQP